MSTSAVALLAGSLIPAGPVQAQPAPQAAQAPIEEIVVTGSLIVRDGFSAPTPTTVMSSADLEAAAPTNIADFVNTLPSLAASATPTTGNGGTSGGTNGQNVFNLRGLGASRTLLLIDGRRVVPTAATATSDANNLPSQLVSRVDVVTGGASAAYGSDAVSGVVNFVLDSKFTGVKGEIEGGITARGDDAQGKFNLSAGTGFADDRGHFLISGEFAKSRGIDSLNPLNRDWFQGIRQVNNPAFISAAATPNVPALLTFAHVNNSLAALGGLITGGPLKGIQFGKNGQVLPFQYGTVYGSFMVGGQFVDSGVEESLDARVNRSSLFTRATYDVTDDIKAFAQFIYGYSEGASHPANQRKFGNLTMKADNAYLPASVAAQLAALKLTTFAFGTDVGDLGNALTDNFRKSLQATFGADGKLGGGWSWSAYYQYGRSDVDNKVKNNQIVANYNASIDAILVNGNIVCRTYLTNPSCVPMNPFGTGVLTDQARAYVVGTSQIKTRLKQQVAEASIHGEPFSLWDGPVSIAAGVGIRREEVSTPYTDPRSLTDAWFAANFKPTVGAYTVKEAFAETVIPLATNRDWSKSFDLDLALRVTNYTTSGTVETYKIGANYRPTTDILLRFTQSRDIRAANLTELYAGGSANTAPLTDPLHGNASISVLNRNVGNPFLTPEKATSTGVGGVYQPSWFPGLSGSVDYYSIRVHDAIASIGTQNEVNLCVSGARPDLCSLITRGPGVESGISYSDAITGIITGPVNLALVTTKGLDLEFGYTKHLDDFVPSWDATVSLRAFGTHVFENKTNNGIGTIHENAGENTGNTPLWKWRTSLTYSQGPVAVTGTLRTISSGVYSTSFFDNSAGPLTVDNNFIPGASYVDFNVTYRLDLGVAKADLYLSIANAFDKDPPVATSNSFLSQQYNPSLYDGVGRFFRGGVRFKL